jgi:hypothetical protein
LILGMAGDLCPQAERLQLRNAPLQAVRIRARAAPRWADDANGVAVL